MASTSKRKGALVAFKTSWEEDFLVTEHRGGAKCQVCYTIFTHATQFNLKRHYTRHHTTDYEQFTREERIRKIQLLKERALQEEEEEEDISDKVSVYNNFKTDGILSSNMSNTISLLSMQKIIFEAQLLIVNLFNAVPISGLIRKSIMQCWAILLKSTIESDQFNVQ